MSAMQCSGSRFCELGSEASAAQYVSLTYFEVGAALVVVALASWGLGSRYAEALWGAVTRLLYSSRAALSQGDGASSAERSTNAATVRCLLFIPFECTPVLLSALIFE
jgi:hypothetical protein